MGLFRAKEHSLPFVSLFLPAVFFLFLLAGLPRPMNAADMTVVGGIIERVSGSVITLADGTYDIGQARVRKPSGEGVPLPEIARGRKVDLYFVKGKVNTVIIYPAVMVE